MTRQTEREVRRGRGALAGVAWRPANGFTAFASTRAHPRAGGDGHPVIVFPGLGGNGSALAPLREHCRSLGHAAFDWGQGYKLGAPGDFDGLLSALAAHTEELLARFDQSATLIGWSLGGFYARELAKIVQPRVRQVITIGTPFNTAADHPNAARLIRVLSGIAAKPGNSFGARLRTPPPMPTTSIYSRTDGVVNWQACRHDAATELVEDIEIEGSHIGMGWNPAVHDVVSDRLGQPAGRWRPYAGLDLAEQFRVQQVTR